MYITKYHYPNYKDLKSKICYQLLHILHFIIEGEGEIGGRRPNRPGGGRNWFQCYLFLGLIGFVTFWLVLMLREAHI